MIILNKAILVVFLREEDVLTGQTTWLTGMGFIGLYFLLLLLGSRYSAGLLASTFFSSFVSVFCLATFSSSSSSLIASRVSLSSPTS